jgi:hypothetical protein
MMPQGPMAQMPAPPQVAPVSPVLPAPAPQLAPTMPTPQPVSSGCLRKKYLQPGFVMFGDVCTHERAVNSTTTQVTSNANCLTKENSQDGIVFKDVCTGEWAMKPWPMSGQANR